MSKWEPFTLKSWYICSEINSVKKMVENEVIIRENFINYIKKICRISMIFLCVWFGISFTEVYYLAVSQHNFCFSKQRTFRLNGNVKRQNCFSCIDENTHYPTDGYTQYQQK